ncbi:hypothetical protein DPEC_G00078510 [Dallia pectoralis]|uniref:Uncharacterized protein n=1 Tax=Dallia pectoralis TaxID=75939 RepID=A0ACC2H4T1_DALPE|nr:hypothetical protein DPEC_G00078510 [Dallia pectoralis]
MISTLLICCRSSSTIMFIGQLGVFPPFVCERSSKVYFLEEPVVDMAHLMNTRHHGTLFGKGKYILDRNRVAAAKNAFRSQILPIDDL